MIDQERCAHINPIDASYVCMHKDMFLLLSIIFRYCTILYYQFDGAPCYFFATIVIRWKFHETILHWSCTDFLLGDEPFVSITMDPSYRSRWTLRIDRSMDPSHRSMDPSYRSMDPSYRSMDPSYRSMDPSYRSIDTSNRLIDVL